jgi:hypothetical protein
MQRGCVLALFVRLCGSCAGYLMYQFKTWGISLCGLSKAPWQRSPYLEQCIIISYKGKEKLLKAAAEPTTHWTVSPCRTTIIEIILCPLKAFLIQISIQRQRFWKLSFLSWCCLLINLLFLCTDFVSTFVAVQCLKSHRGTPKEPITRPLPTDGLIFRIHFPASPLRQETAFRRPWNSTQNNTRDTSIFNN